MSIANHSKPSGTWLSESHAEVTCNLKGPVFDLFDLCRPDSARPVFMTVGHFLARPIQQLKAGPTEVEGPYI